MEEENTFDPELIREIFRLIWQKRASDRVKNQLSETEAEVGVGVGVGVGAGAGAGAGASTSKKGRLTSANANAIKMSSELLRLFVAETIERAASIADAEGLLRIEATHLERILPQLLLDF